jgi:16S rRNA (cytosine967-C5)-methyltransferase
MWGRMTEDTRKEGNAAPGVAARAATLKLLDAVLRRGLPLEGALPAATRGLERSEDRALAHALAAEVLRRLPDLDALIDSATAKPLPRDAKARMALRIALAQALRLGTPGHAAIATVLPLVDGGPRRLVHGVFGSLTRKGATLPEAPALPEEVATRWHEAWGEEVVAAAGRAVAAPPPIDITLRAPDETQAWGERLGGDSLAAGHVRLPSARHVPELAGFADGAWWVQDIAASLPARLMGAGQGRRALDLCCAPGGKTMQLAAAGWVVEGIDLSEARLARVSENLERTGLSAELKVADALTFSAAAPVDAVLLDAPCSATGIFRRHPDVLHRARPRAIAGMAERQQAMLARAANWVKPGGMLVYAVCSLEPQEGEQVADAFLAAHRDFTVKPVEADELPEGIVPDATGRVRVLPGMLATKGGADGFFVARFQRQ